MEVEAVSKTRLPRHRMGQPRSTQTWKLCFAARTDLSRLSNNLATTSLHRLSFCRRSLIQRGTTEECGALAVSIGHRYRNASLRTRQQRILRLERATILLAALHRTQSCYVLRDERRKSRQYRLEKPYIGLFRLYAHSAHLGSRTQDSSNPVRIVESNSSYLIPRLIDYLNVVYLYLIADGFRGDLEYFSRLFQQVVKEGRGHEGLCNLRPTSLTMLSDLLLT